MVQKWKVYTCQTCCLGSFWRRIIGANTLLVAAKIYLSLFDCNSILMVVQFVLFWVTAVVGSLLANTAPPSDNNFNYRANLYHTNPTPSPVISKSKYWDNFTESDDWAILLVLHWIQRPDHVVCIYTTPFIIELWVVFYPIHWNKRWLMFSSLLRDRILSMIKRLNPIQIQESKLVLGLLGFS